jgi:predicted AlkP superfamily phosphohydrolase/phosphomutase
MLKRIPFAVIAGSLLAFALLPLACGQGTSPEKFKQKMVILGFDGMDPRLVEKWMGEGKLPNFKKLADQGGFYRLQTSTSPESPTSWASFAIGGNAGKHNIFDFLVRDVKTYVPDLGMVRREMPDFLFDFVPLGKPKITTLRGGTSFWVTAGQAGVRSAILTVPVTFPPETVPSGEMLSGLPLPDIRGTVGTFYYFATDLSRYEEGNTEMGGILKRLSFEGDVAQSELTGPPNPIVQAQMAELRKKGAALAEGDQAKMAALEATRDVRVPFSLRWNRQERSATVDVQGTTVHLTEGQWSKWVPLEFRVNYLVRIYGMSQFFLVRASGELQLYMSPVNWRPESPVMPISSPTSLSKDLYERLGTFRTLGWAEATWPLNEDRIDEKTFMDDLFRAFDDRSQVILHEIDSKKFDLVIGVLESTDRVQHMFWRFIDPTHPMYDAAAASKYGDSIERVYKRCDQLVGEVLQRIDKDTLVFVLSDHGFHSFKYGVNLNTWLVENGFIARQGKQLGDKNLNDMFGGGGQFWEGVDWTRTRAYSLGLGQIYFNIRGREGQGIVSEGDDYKRLSEELSARLLTMTDPNTGQHIVRHVYKRDDIYSGPFMANAPDLQVGFEDGYRVSWQTSLGGSPPGLLYPNMKKWSGDHCSFDYETIPGTLISNRKLGADKARIVDIAPTVLKYFGVGIPKEIDGRPLF